MCLFLRLVVIGIGLGACCIAGCGSSKTERTPEFEARERMQDVATILRLFATQTGQGPTNIEELDEFQNSSFDSFQFVKNGEIVIIWGMNVPGEGEKGTEAVVAYEKKAKTDKGLVLLHNGNIVSMDSSALSAALK